MSNNKLQGKTCLITGATSGIGEVAAIELAKMGADVVLVGRNKQRCEDSLQKVLAAQTVGKCSYLLADMSSRAQVLTLADQFKKENERLDVLL
ncbi:MAG: SDR family NAD(P)-dependent oxidoreductase, partial [Cyanobacteria bacterium]|nr:SDR family NAD(P)-dependent oxidoreductase [Cyanobacteriota bacterium]